MRKAALLCIALLSCVPSLATGRGDPAQPVPVVSPSPPTDHLDRPLLIPNDRYQASLHQLFGEAFAENVRVRVLAEPSFEPEYAVAIVTTGNRFQVLYIKAAQNQWYNGHVRVATSRCSADIDPLLAERIIGTWTRMIAAVPLNGEVRMGLDGDGYYFAMTEGRREQMAQTWSPDEGTAPAMLVDLVTTMAMYCWSRQWSLLAPLSWYYAASMERQVTELNARLNADVRAR